LVPCKVTRHGIPLTGVQLQAVSVAGCGFAWSPEQVCPCSTGVVTASRHIPFKGRSSAAAAAAV
jgi:hypothetical protein